MQFLQSLVFSASLAAFVILFISKIGLRDNIIMKSPVKLISQLFECDFCLSFWANVCISILICIAMKDPKYIVIPFFAAPLTRIMI